jgi:hypothetical protein
MASLMIETRSGLMSSIWMIADGALANGGAAEAAGDVEDRKGR